MSIPVDSSWKLTFDDEFNGNSLDFSEWGNNWLGNPGEITKPVDSSELGAYDPAQVTVGGGYLHLSAIDSPVTVNGVDYEYRSGLVNTHGQFSQAYGYFEARLWLPGSGGKISDWPAFWTDGENWPTDGEMDIMEGLEGNASYHFHSSSGGPGVELKDDYTGWHTFGAWWQPGKVSYYYDNQLVGTITSGITDQPMYMILNLGIGIHSILEVPAEMLVDWVHVYSSDSSATAVAAQAGYTGPGGTGATNVIAGTAGSDVLTGTSTNDVIRSGAGEDLLKGLAGSDALKGGTGADVLNGNGGDDRLLGGAGKDTLTGDLGADRFVFRFNDSHGGNGSADVITDFSSTQGDRISLALIDANSNIGGDQRFDFIGNSHFSDHAGELRYEGVSNGVMVQADVNGDGVADFAVRVIGVSLLSSDDFIL